MKKSLHPNELDKIDWAILVTVLYRYHPTSHSPTLTQRGTNGIDPFGMFYPINSIIYNGTGFTPLTISQLNELTKFVNHELKTNLQYKQLLKNKSIYFNLENPVGDVYNFNINGLGFNFRAGNYSFRYYPMKEKFEKFFKETIWNPTT